MSGFFSHSSSRRRYPDPNMGGAHYRRKGLFGMLSGLGSGFSSRSSRGHYGQGYPNQGYPNQGYPDPGQGGFQPTAPAAGGQAVCPKCGASVPAGSKFCLSCGAPINTAAFCQNCGKPLPPNAKFCPECGTPRR